MFPNTTATTSTTLETLVSTLQASPTTLLTLISALQATQTTMHNATVTNQVTAATSEWKEYNVFNFSDCRPGGDRMWCFLSFCFWISVTTISVWFGFFIWLCIRRRKKTD